MHTVLLKTNKPEDLPLDFYPAKFDSHKAFIFVPGSGDVRSTNSDIFEGLRTRLPDYNLVNFAYTGHEENSDYATQYPLRQQVIDLNLVMEYLINKKQIEQIYLVATSAGAFCCCFAVIDPKYANNIKYLLLLDPAAYYISDIDSHALYTWTGDQEYAPEGPTCCDLLPRIQSNIIVDVIHLTFRNFGAGDYLDKDFKDRGKAYEIGHPRLNTQMMQVFYNNVPEHNKGKYLEMDGIPHAFHRDGDIPANLIKVIGLIANCFTV